MTEHLPQHTLRNHKDTVFRKLFSEKKAAIELYNALEGTDYGPETDIEFTTLEDVIYINRKNDLGFIIDKKYVVITEHQSTISYNLPLRDLFYISRTYENIVKQFSLYDEQPIKLPTPEFYVVYTGSREWAEETLRLSDYFKEKPPINSLDLVVKIIKIGYTGAKEEIMKKSPTLLGYNTLLNYIKEYKGRSADLKTAIDKAVERCISEGYLTDFLRKHGGEVTSMLFEEITAEKFAEIRAEEAARLAGEKAYNQGIADGEKLGIVKGEKLGITKGEKLGLAKGIEIMKAVLELRAKGMSPDEIAGTVGCELELVEEILR